MHTEIVKSFGWHMASAPVTHFTHSLPVCSPPTTRSDCRSLLLLSPPYHDGLALFKKKTGNMQHVMQHCLRLR